MWSIPIQHKIIVAKKKGLKVQEKIEDDDTRKIHGFLAMTPTNKVWQAVTFVNQEKIYTVHFTAFFYNK